MEHFCQTTLLEYKKNKRNNSLFVCCNVVHLLILFLAHILRRRLFEMKHVDATIGRHRYLLPHCVFCERAPEDSHWNEEVIEVMWTEQWEYIRTARNDTVDRMQTGHLRWGGSNPHHRAWLYHLYINGVFPSLTFIVARLRSRYLSTRGCKSHKCQFNFAECHK